MAYDKHVWTCGEAITTEKLNHMEDGIASGGGYECTEAYTEVFNDEIAPSSGSPYPFPHFDIDSLFINADKIKVTFDGTEYVCDAVILGAQYAYGVTNPSAPPTFDEYPFLILSSEGMGTIIGTQNEGTYNVKIEALELNATTSKCFDTATRKAVNASGNCVGITQYYESAEDASEGVPFIPWRVSSCIFENLTAISIAQGLSQEVTLAPDRDISRVGYIVIMEIYNTQGDGLLPPITGIKTGVDAESDARTYVLKLTAKDGAISIPQYGLHITALTFEEAHTVRTICAVEGTCCEEDTPT